MPMARAHSLLDAADLFPARAPCLPLSPMPPGLLPFALSTPAAPPAVCPTLLPLPVPAGPLPSRVPPVPPNPLLCAPLLLDNSVTPPDLLPVALPTLIATAICWPPDDWLLLPVVSLGTSDDTRMPPPRDLSLPEADPAPTLTARIAILAASPSAVLKATIGICESRHHASDLEEGVPGLLRGVERLPMKRTGPACRAKSVHTRDVHMLLNTERYPPLL